MKPKGTISRAESLLLPDMTSCSIGISSLALRCRCILPYCPYIFWTIESLADRLRPPFFSSPDNGSR